MNVHHSSFLLVVLCLHVRDGSIVEALSHYGVSGENFTFPCIPQSTGAMKMFCRETCEGNNLLINSNDDSAQHGRYRTEYVKEATKTYSVLSVSISELTWSDSGLYQCGLGDSSSSASLQNFSVIVVDAVLDGHKVPRFYKEAGGSLTVACFFEDFGRKRLFCRGECKEDDVLVQTDGVRAERGRYSLIYDRGPRKAAVLLMTITQLTQSDSGLYRCKMDRTLLPDLYRDFSISVTDAAEPSTATPTATQTLSSSSGSFTPSVSSDTTHPLLTPSEIKSQPNVLLMVVTLSLTIIVLSVALLLCWRKTADKPQKAPEVQLEETPTPEPTTIYENLSEADVLWKAVDETVYSVYVETSNTRTTGGELDEDSSSESMPL